MADMRISKVLPTVNCSDCGKAVHVREIADHVCGSAAATLPPVPSLPPLAVDTSPATIQRPRKSSNKSLDSSSPLSGSRFNFHFWTGKAKDTLKNATTLGSKKSMIAAQSPSTNTYEHAITTPSAMEQQHQYHRHQPQPPLPQQRERKMSFGKPTYQEKTWLPEDDELISPIFDFTPPFAQHYRKNSTSPAPPPNFASKFDKQKPPRSTSSDETTSPITPHGTIANDFFSPTSSSPSRRCARCHRDVVKENAIPVHDDVNISQKKKEMTE
ncbi:hypothetical protein BDA99DRAFT_84090 [Phascolomyces articulosus]|uniref:Uncharacterized protein n=1 Tax=Phascolomyces articulosus TaxID=60185 RepID=A0AAD5K8P6_9FUNG|nr:hypothetical protein BDA99DRAFT_84090 [Phascolomyces articulosus]